MPFRGEPGDVCGVADDRCCTDRSNPSDLRQRRIRCCDHLADALLGCLQRVVEPFHVGDDLACNQHPDPGRLIEAGDVAQQAGSVAGVDVSADSSWDELDQQRMETVR